MSRSQTDQILQSTTMPDKMEVTLSPAVAILDRDTHTQGPGFIQTKFEISTIVHAGAAYNKGTRCTDCANKSIQYEASPC